MQSLTFEPVPASGWLWCTCVHFSCLPYSPLPRLHLCRRPAVSHSSATAPLITASYPSATHSSECFLPHSVPHKSNYIWVCVCVLTFINKYKCALMPDPKKFKWHKPAFVIWFCCTLGNKSVLCKCQTSVIKCHRHRRRHCSRLYIVVILYDPPSISKTHFKTVEDFSCWPNYKLQSLGVVAAADDACIEIFNKHIFSNKLSWNSSSSNSMDGEVGGRSSSMFAINRFEICLYKDAWLFVPLWM